MTFTEKINSLKKQKEEIDKELRQMAKRIDNEEWLFCLHTGWDEPRVSAWKRCYGTNDTAQFRIIDNQAHLTNAGKYWETWPIAQALINDCINKFQQEDK